MLIGLWGMCAKYQFVLCESGSPNLFNSFRFTDKAVQTHTLLVSLRCSTLALSLFLREKWLSDGKLDGWKASLEQFFVEISCVGNGGGGLFRDHLFCFSVEISSVEKTWKSDFLSQEGVSLSGRVGNNPMFLSRFVASPLRHSHMLRCIVTKELHHLNVEQICVGLVISQIMSAHVSTTKASPLPQKLL